MTKSIREFISIVENLERPVSKNLFEDSLETAIPSGLYFDIDDIRLDRSYQGLGIGSLFYKLVITCIARFNNQVKGVLSPKKNRLATAGNVSKIYSQLGGKVDIRGNKDSYDLLPISSMIQLDIEPQPGAQIKTYTQNNLDISINVEEAGPYRIVLSAFDHKKMKKIGEVSATIGSWNSQTETYDIGNIEPN